jgi:hypothetical protein
VSKDKGELNMTNEEIIQTMLSKKKGRYVNLKKEKNLGNGVKKITDMVIRLGVDYSKMKVNEGRETEIGSLPWGKWVEGLEGYVIEHKGNYYLRVASSYSNTTKSIYTLNGVEVGDEIVNELVAPSKLASKPSDVYNIKFSNIISLN